MIRRIKMLILMLFVGASVCAMEKEDQAPTPVQGVLFDKETMIVPLLDEDDISQFKELLEQEHIARGRYRLLTAGAVVAGTAFLAHHFIKKWAAKEKAKHDEYRTAASDLEESKNKLKADDEERKKKKGEEKAAAPAVESVKLDSDSAAADTFAKTEDPAKIDASSWPSWISGPASWGWGHIKGIGGLGWDVGAYFSERYVKSLIIGILGGYVFGVFPYPARAARYVFQPWSLWWCIHERTNFYASTIELKALTADMLVKAKKFGLAPSSQSKADVWYSSYLFVIETQKILGYMHYIIGSLRPEDKRVRDLGCASIAIIRECINRHSEDMNTFLQSDATITQVAEMAHSSAQCLYTVINQLESFEAITDQVGQKERDKKDRFAAWKAAIMPGILNKTPKLLEEEAKAQEMPSFKDVFDLASDVNANL